MTEKTKGGFTPGQDLSFADLMAMRAQTEPTDAPTPLPTREDIATMPKAEVIEWLEAHGAEVDKRTGEEKLRAALLSVLFVEDHA